MSAPVSTSAPAAAHASSGAASAAAAARRALAGLPRLLRAAGGELLHDDRPADERGLRLHVDADQHPARRAAHPPRRRLRRRPQDLPQRDLRRVQGQPLREPDRLPRARSAWSRRCWRALRVPVITAENYEADDVIATLTVQAVEQGMDVLIATGDRDALQLVNDARHRAVPAQGRLGHDPVHAGGGRDQVRPDAGAVPRLRRAAGRPERQPAEHPERGGEDRGQVGPRVRLPRRAGRPGRHGQGQGRREAARAPVLGAAEPPADRARPRRAAELGPRPTSPSSRGTATRCTPSSTTCSSGCCATGCSPPSPAPSRRSRAASTSPRTRSRPAAWASGCRPTPAPAGPG